MCKYCYSPDKKEVSIFTQNIHKKFAKDFNIDLEDAFNEEIALASQNCILKVDNFDVKDSTGRVVWSLKPFDFYRQKAVADTIHPSLWLNGKANFEAGVFEVVKKKIYQVRGLDSSNITFVRTRTGWILMDPGMCIECSRAALELAEKALGEKIDGNVKAIIISHTHVDHFGGVGGVIDEASIGKLEDGKVPIYVPAGFDQEVMKENVYAGNAMSRRGALQGGGGIEDGVKGRVSLGAALTSSFGTLSYIVPTDYIAEDCTLEIDGLEVEFQLTPGTEAPVEMNNYFPEYKAFWAAENCCCSLHNLYPIRGAQIRDAANWWLYTKIALERYGRRANVVFQAHNWPHFNTPENPHGVEEFLRNTAAVYKFIHDETLHYANKGKTAKEIAKLITLPEHLQKVWYTRPYYGSVEINARAVYNKYLGFFSANPTDLNPLTELEEAKQFVDYVGSEEKVLELALKDFEEGNYQRAAKAANYVVYVNPKNMEARYLCADAFEQQGYQSESSIWRNAYLAGAKELRDGTPKARKGSNHNNALVTCMTPKMLLDYLGILTESTKLSELDRKFRLFVTDRDEEFTVHVYYGTLLYYQGKTEEELPYVKLTVGSLLALTGGQLNSVKDNIDTNCIDILEKINDAVIDLSEYNSFPLIER